MAEGREGDQNALKDYDLVLIEFQVGKMPFVEMASLISLISDPSNVAIEE